MAMAIFGKYAVLSDVITKHSLAHGQLLFRVASNKTISTKFFKYIVDFKRSDKQIKIKPLWLNY